MTKLPKTILYGLLTVALIFSFGIFKAHAAIAFDAVTSGNYTASGTQTTSLTVGSGSNTVLFVWNEAGSTGADPSGITYNGVALTQKILGVTNDGISLWYLVNPSSGTHNIVVTSSFQIYMSAVSYSGVDQTNPVNVSNSASSTSTSAAVSVTPNVANTWMASYTQDDATASFATTASDVQRGTTGTFGDLFMVDTNATIASGSSHTQTVTVQNSAWFMVGIAIAPATAAPAVISNFFF